MSDSTDIRKITSSGYANNMKKLAPLVLAWAIALVLAFSGIEHLKNPWFFVNTIFKYKLISGTTVLLFAVFAPVIQLTFATMIVSNVYKKIALIMAGVMFLVFSLAQSMVLYQGLEISSGRFGSFSHSVSITTIALDSLLACLAFFCAKSSKA